MMKRIGRLVLTLAMLLVACAAMQADDLLNGLAPTGGDDIMDNPFTFAR